MWMLTEERKNELLRQKENKLTELETLKKKTLSDLWREDLDVFSEELDKVEKKELADATADLKEKKIPVSVLFVCFKCFCSRLFHNTQLNLFTIFRV